LRELTSCERHDDRANTNQKVRLTKSGCEQPQRACHQDKIPDPIWLENKEAHKCAICRNRFRGKSDFFLSLGELLRLEALEIEQIWAIRGI
jgi:hypothetical protein